MGELFREKSLKSVKSPESLDDYIRVSAPGVWLLLISILFLIAGTCVWGIFGHVDSTVKAGVYAENGTAVCYVAEEDVSAVREEMPVRFDGFEAVVAEVGQREEQGYACLLRLQETVPDGFYEGEIVTESVRPLSFVLN